MKNIFAIAIASLAISSIQAQDINDAMRFAQTDLNGTARFKAMGGAFGAVGGDFSALNINPAGSLIFANNQVGLTLTNFNDSNNSNYFGTSTSARKNSLDLNQAGAVFVFNNQDTQSDWRKFAFTINYENAKNLDNNIFSEGTNPNNSVDKYFLSYANGVSLGTLNNYYFDELYYNEQQAYLGYNSYIINAVPLAIDPTNNTNPNINTYTSGVAPGGNYYQKNRIKSNGYNSKVSFNFAAQYTDKWLFGINLNSHFLDYRKSSSFYESNSNSKFNTGSTVDVIRFNNDLYTYGSGFSLQLGTIFKPVKEIRLGIAYESPTWYKLTDELSQRISTSVYGLSTSPNSYSSVTTDPNTTMIFAPYNLQSPGKWTGSFAYIFGKRGLISLDLSSKSYGTTTYRPKGDFTSTNTFMANNLTNATEVRIGGEYKIKKISLRGGYRYEQSPYKNGTTIGALTGYSTGLGYNFGNTKLDLAYANAKRDYDQQFFSQGLTDTARIKSVNNNVTITLLFEL
ncbi:OmpP1/FadL family transporter [Flavobacterium sp.]|uniref:OmpP1/FadL family transporter n=1 Tax=Flavobacterium sp. TaxID=239 RepID=UPI003BBAA46B